MLPGIMESLLSPKWIENLPFARPPKVSHLKPKDVKDIVDQTRILKDTSDVTPMALANIAIELAGVETVMGKVLHKVVGILET